MYQLVSQSSSSIRSKRGHLALPGELWNDILSYASDNLKEMWEDAKDDGPRYTLCQAKVVEKQSGRAVLRCVKIDFERTVQCGMLNSPCAISCVEDFLQKPTTKATPILTTSTRLLPRALLDYKNDKGLDTGSVASLAEDGSTEDAEEAGHVLEADDDCSEYPADLDPEGEAELDDDDEGDRGFNDESEQQQLSEEGAIDQELTEEELTDGELTEEKLPMAKRTSIRTKTTPTITKTLRKAATKTARTAIAKAITRRIPSR
ncbi:hypothetical protein GE09DRAFT_65783 [Coniochaeta sp. 2T2.1]|nr:hypothetical protein GE09DRAFT_65783 [Coniochaeta sp. 2T2.1]